MKRTARGLLIAQKVIGIILIVLFAILPVAFVIAGPIMMVQGDFNGSEDELALATAGLTLLIEGIVFAIVVLPLAVVSRVLNGIAIRTLNNAKSRDEARKGAICSIVSGALMGVFGIPAGVIMLVMNDAHYE